MYGYERVLSVLLAIAIAIPAFSADQTWTGATSNNWGTAANWSGSAVPGSGDKATIPAGLSVYPVISSGSFTARDFIVASGASCSMTGGILNLEHDWKNSGTFDATGGEVVFTGSAGPAADFSKGTNQFFHLTVNSGVDPKFDAKANSSILVKGNFTNNNTELDNSANATFTFNGDGNQTIASAATNATFGTLVINTSGGSVSLASAVKVAGNATIMNGTLDCGAYVLSRKTNGGTLSVGNGGTLKIGGVNGMPTSFTTRTFAALSTVEYSGSNQSVSAEAYGNLVLSGSGTKTLPGTALTLAGSFTMKGTASATAAATIAVNGNFSLGTGTSFNAGTYSHSIKGDFSNSGTFAAGTSTVTINGTVEQACGGSNSTTFNNLVVNNANGLVLNTGQIVNGILDLTNGKVTVGSCNLTLGPSATIIGTSPTNYIVTGESGGKVTRNVGSGSAVTFHVGTSSSYNPVTIQTETGSDDFSVSVLAGVSPSSSNDEAAVQRTWEISEAVPGGNGFVSVTVQWNDGEQGSLFNRAIAEAWKNDGSGWVLHAGSVSNITPGAAYPATATFHTTSFSRWTIANDDGALPIQLAYFNGMAVRSMQSVALSWGTVSETNNFGFYVQQSVGTPGSFSDLPGSFVPGHGTTLEPQHYSWTHTGVAPGTYYYRLKQVDFDATVHCTDPIQVVMSPLSGVGSDASVPVVFALQQNYPNPFNPTTTVEFTVTKAGPATVKVYNLIGQELVTLFQGMTEPGRRYSIAFDASSLSSGIYIYKLVTQDQSASRKMTLLK
jgi:fibronectin-binding autotransporter adhesin